MWIWHEDKIFSCYVISLFTHMFYIIFCTSIRTHLSNILQYQTAQVFNFMCVQITQSSLHCYWLLRGVGCHMDRCSKEARHLYLSWALVHKSCTRWSVHSFMFVSQFFVWLLKHWPTSKVSWRRFLLLSISMVLSLGFYAWWQPSASPREPQPMDQPGCKHAGTRQWALSVLLLLMPC